MRRLKLNEDMVRRIEDALDERKQQRRGPAQPPEYPADRRTPATGRRKSDRAPPPAVQDPAGLVLGKR
jgi:hypothetical protein